MAIETKTITYEFAGKAFDAVVAYDDEADGPQPGVMICHAWGGRKGHEEATALAIAEMGYVGFAADIYGVGVRGETTEECQALMTPLVEDEAERHGRLAAALTAMKGLDEVESDQTAVIGYCFGGLCALDMARINAKILGAVAFHAIIKNQGVVANDPIKPKVIAYQGYDDPMSPPEDLKAFSDEMTERNADWQLVTFGGVKHAFTNVEANNPDLGTIYNEGAARRSWVSFTNFLEELFV
ncbi:dienelactone hydrolase family protein [Parvularcula sp. LCG005]|uniref:dienelactone hydrolase family protein n=1 Tax=Parvularcula sp. LCG005 TaxID=3078805 RepID=UPI0029429B7F|nr:dienelactone hydrolase family protein [Parvularcula sp. LCG005]WOI54337.1 dienelactone hydrolase family protein [Parvularcula sp. LCG005]